jgi:hypothetical protein
MITAVSENMQLLRENPEIPLKKSRKSFVLKGKLHENSKA